MEKDMLPVSNYWINTDKFDIKNDPDLKNLKDNFILGKKVSENDSSVELSFEVNKKQITKTVNKEFLIKTEYDKNIEIKNLSQGNSFTPYDVVYNILNSYNRGKYFNFLTDDIILTYTKYPISNVQENYFENFLLIGDYNKTLHQNSAESLKQFEHLKDNIKKVLECEQDDYSEIAYDEMYLKLVQRIFEKENNCEINFISNSVNDYSNDYEEIKYLFQNFSVYNKQKIFKEKELKSKFEKEYKIYDLIYSGMKILEMFGCGSNINYLKSDNVIIPRFTFRIKLNLDKDLNHCKSAKIEILTYNRDIFDNYDNCDSSSERIFNILHILPKHLSSNLQTEFNIDSEVRNYNLFSKYKKALIKENQNDEEDYKLLFDTLWKLFDFNQNEVNFIIQFISLILNITNLEFIQTDGNISIKKKNLEEIRKVLKLKSEIINDEDFAKLFTHNINSQPYKTIESCQRNVNLIIKDIYESLFYFIVDKINQQLEYVDNNSIITLKNNYKEHYITNTYYQSKLIISNPFDFNNIYNFENYIKNFNSEKIDNYLDKLKEENFIISKVEYEYDKTNKTILGVLENIIKNSLIAINPQSESESDEEFFNNNSVSLNNFDAVNKVFISTIQKNNFLKANTCLINLLSLFEKSLNFSNADSKDENETIKLSKLIFIDKNKLNCARNILNEFIKNQNEVISNSDKLLIVNLSDVFNRDTDLIILKNNFLSTLKKLKLKSYIENILSVYPHLFTLRKFVDKYSIPILQNTDKIPDLNLPLTANEILNKLNTVSMNTDMKTDIIRGSFIISNSSIIINNSLFLKLTFLEKTHFSKLKQNKKVYKTMAIIKGFTTRQSLKKIKDNSLPIIENKENKNELNNAFDSIQITQEKEVDDIDIEKENRIKKEIKTDIKEKKDNLIIEPLKNDIILKNEKKESIIEYSDLFQDSLNNMPENNKICFYSFRVEELTDEHKILKIQGAWIAKRESKLFNITRIKVFIIQRCYRKYLIKKYDLPDNYFYNEKFLRVQHEKYEKNFLDNSRVLFPAMFDNNLKNSTLSNKNILNTNLVANNLQHSAYMDEKIHLFTKVLDIDLMVETDEVYDNVWASNFDKIYSHCLKLNSPIQTISLGSAHTVCVNSKGKVFTFGWNNYGQCGVPINSSIIAKYEIENEFLIEFTKYNELKPKVLNKVEGIKIPQFEEVITTKNIACGEDHTLVLDQEGCVWAFGLNLNGQLGLGHQNGVDKPVKIKSLSKSLITSVKSEGDISFAVSDKGEAFMWPFVDKSGNFICEPIKLPLNNITEKVTSIACGNNFVLLLNQSGMVYSMGKSNSYGQLGHGDTNPRYRPILIDFFVVNNERITQISCGYKHCAARSTIGHAYTWGLGVKGQLGHGDYNNYTLPYQVKVESTNSKIYQVSASFRSTYFLIESRKVYFTGCNGNISMQNAPIQFNFSEKIPEFSNELNYSIVRIMNTWNKSFSIFYATIADTTLLKDTNLPKLNQILSNLCSKWDPDSVDAPYIEAISKYFPSSYMKKPKDYINKNRYI